MQKTRIGIACIVVIFLLGMLIFGDASITGFVPSQSFVQKVDINVDESQRFTLKSPDGVPFGLTTLALSGHVTGSGLAKVYLVKGKERLLIYSNAEKKRTAMEEISGLVVQDIRIEPGDKLQKIESVEAGYHTVEGSFSQMCIDTCILEGSRSPSFFMDVIVEPGTSLSLTEIQFTLPE